MSSNREPWIKIKIGLFDSEKLAALPDDSARWGYGKLLGKAKTQRRMGVFVSRAHVEDVVGRHAIYFDAWLGEGLIHIAPALCPDCAARHEPDQLKVGEVVIHDYLLEQRDPTRNDRVDTWRKLQAALRALEEAGIPVPVTDNVTANVTLHRTPAARSTPAPDVTPDSVTTPPAEHEPSAVTANVTPDSRARGMTVTVTTTETETTKKDVSDGVVDGAKANTARDPDHLPLPDPNRAGRPRASRALTPPDGIAAATPPWRTPPGPCPTALFAEHQTSHRVVDGQAICGACLAKAVTPSGVTKTNGVVQDGLGLA